MAFGETGGEMSGGATVRGSKKGSAWRWVLYPLVVLLVIAAAFIVNTIWFKPLFIRVFFDRVFVEIALKDPELMTQVGIFESFGYRAHNAKLTDISIAAEDETYAKLKRDYEMLMSYDDTGLSPSNLLSKRILAYFLKQQIELEPYRYHNYPVNQLFGLQNNVPSFLDTFHRITDSLSAKHYISRLEAIPVKFEQGMEGLEVREEKGIIPPTFVIDKVLEEMKNFIAQPVKKNILYTSFQKKLEETSKVPEVKKTEFLARAETAIAEKVYPAYRSYIDYFTALRPKSTTEAGVWKLPDGDRFYRLQLEAMTTTDLSPDQIHNIGLAEVERIQGEILDIFEAQGYDRNLGFTALIEQLAAEDRFYYPDTEDGREQILEDYRKIIAEIEKGMNKAFRLKPAIGVEVRRVPEFKEKTSPGAYYNPPALDGSRPGIFYANLYDIKATPKYSMRTLAYHEAVPGHHFQIGIQQNLKGLPIFRNFPLFTAYAEGWALYAEQLAWELGFQDDPFDNVGRLQAELFRAVRLVVDTGIHAKRWTREQAIDYMAANTGMAMSDVVAEIERYIVNPGQACAYKVGMLEILRLREKARQRLGDAFDIRDFHDVVLGNGALPLQILEEQVDAWLERREAA